MNPIGGLGRQWRHCLPTTARRRASRCHGTEAKAHVSLPAQFVVKMSDSPRIAFTWHEKGARLLKTRGHWHLIAWLAVVPRGGSVPRYLRWLRWELNFDADFDTSSSTPTDWSWNVGGKAMITSSGEGKLVKSVDLRTPVANNRFKDSRGT